MNTTHIGKIARLDPFIRDHLNRKLAAGEPGKTILKWLNTHPSVQETLDLYFEGRAVTAQNLSEWKQRGFREWQGRQEARAEAWAFLSEAEELNIETDRAPLLDKVSSVVALTLLRMLQKVASAPEQGPKERAEALAISRELARWRSGDHERQRRELDEARLESEEFERERLRDAERLNKHESRMTISHIHADMARQQYCEEFLAGTLNPERAAEIEEFFAENAAWFAKCRIRPLPTREWLGREAARLARLARLKERHRVQEQARKEKARARGEEVEEEDEELDSTDADPGESEEWDTEEIAENPSESDSSYWLKLQVPPDPFKGTEFEQPSGRMEERRE